MKLTFEQERRRSAVEGQENWRDWLDTMPALHFDRDWDVRIIPPFHGALARFWIDYQGKHVSVYFDAYNRLGFRVDENGAPKPYFEMYDKTTGDTERYNMDEVDAMMDDIRRILNGETEHDPDNQ